MSDIEKKLKVYPFTARSFRDMDGVVEFEVYKEKMTLALEEIKKLQAENAELKKQGEWISVDDELPDVVGDRSDGVLILRDLGNGTVPTVCVSFLWSTKMQMHFSHNAPFEITDCWSKQESKGYRVTHWMPLPTPPKGE